MLAVRRAFFFKIGKAIIVVKKLLLSLFPSYFFRDI
ncbi:hypothetical protein MGA3_14696 [Bacillus methanolicus MGA3]|nr:hypothetical protein MGA3_14696 [Bacillus methanolicus MGA3]